MFFSWLRVKSTPKMPPSSDEPCCKKVAKERMRSAHAGEQCDRVLPPGVPADHTTLRLYLQPTAVRVVERAEMPPVSASYLQ